MSEEVKSTMEKIIMIASRGRLVVYYDGKEVRVRNETSCHLLINNQIVAPGQEI